MIMSFHFDLSLIFVRLARDSSSWDFLVGAPALDPVLTQYQTVSYTLGQFSTSGIFSDSVIFVKGISVL